MLGGAGGGSSIDNGSNGGTGSAGSAGFIVITYFASVTFTQNTYRWYVDNDLAAVDDPWSVFSGVDLAENTTLAAIPFENNPPGDATGSAERLRLRINLTVNNDNLAADNKYFKLEYKKDTDGSCTTGAWDDVPGPGGGAAWDFSTSTITDGATISAVLSNTTTGRHQDYVKSTPTGLNPVAANINEIIEYDFHIVYAATATANTTYSFRVVETDSTGAVETTFDAYPNCPTLTTRPAIVDFLRHGNVYNEEGQQGGFYWAD